MHSETLLDPPAPLTTVVHLYRLGRERGGGRWLQGGRYSLLSAAFDCSL